MSAKMDAESYLRSGSNELRVLEYRTTGMSFGINILKVSKIVSDLNHFTDVPGTHTAVKGVFRDMNRLVPVVDLAEFLGVAGEKTKRQKVIVTEFFGTQTGFWVEQIDWIHHFRWEDVIDAESVFQGIDHRYVIGIVKPTEERMVLLLDYETILMDLCPHLQRDDLERGGVDVDFTGKKILVAEDSPAVRAMLVNELTENGGEVVQAGDGQVAWDQFQKQEFHLVICDVEMPQMDGLNVVLRIRQSERSDTPVIVYSSIGDIGMKARANFLKADAHITKLNMDKLLSSADTLLRGEKLEADTEAIAESEETEEVQLVSVE
ncbi:MAG: chemotaxis protein CheV [candidate division Zixibacteria bacterium]|nr:chemotaxis protein CheV [candidate division Zixibacteria bacterium]MDH3938327.1 chemotaxis protein CheV [candidate division Zixibacteria bacterium]MDH4033681.1 chemotaxis protein CheV [candidate division Zixibacteria bacterium]